MVYIGDNIKDPLGLPTQVVFIRGKYYIAETTSSDGVRKLYKVFVDSPAWQAKVHAQYSGIYLNQAIDWINNRRCFKVEE